METCENGKKIPERSRSVLGRFYCILKQKTTRSFTYLPCYSVLYKNITVTNVEIFFQNVVPCSTEHLEVSAKFHMLDSVIIVYHPQPFSYRIFWEDTFSLFYILQKLYHHESGLFFQGTVLSFHDSKINDTFTLKGFTSAKLGFTVGN